MKFTWKTGRKFPLVSARSLIAVFALSFTCASPSAFAAESRDMWTAAAEGMGLYSPHVNDCDSSTEAFIQVGGGNTGYCIEKNERSNATWNAARQNCLDEGKRLPEPMEWQYACYNGVGLSNMTGAWEWASNSTTIVYGHGPATTIFGYTGCGDGAWGWPAHPSNGAESRAYRCVR